MEPPMSPSPRNAIRSGRARAAARRFAAPPPTGGLAGCAASADVRSAVILAPLPDPPVRPAPLAVRRSRAVGGILPTVVEPAVAACSPIRLEPGAAPRAAALLGEQRLERRGGVDLPTAGPADDRRHAADPSGSA